MRIVNEWSKLNKKYTLFHYNMKYTLKIEDHLTEQSYKLGDIPNFDIDRLKEALDSDDLKYLIRQNFNNIHITHQNIISFIIKDAEFDDFESII